MEEPSAGAGAVDGGVAARLEGLRLADGDGNGNWAREEGSPTPQTQQPPGPAQPQLLAPGSTVPHHLEAAFVSGPPPVPVVEHAWGPADARGFPVRAAHYKRLGRKAPGAESFYELKAFDLVQTPRGAYVLGVLGRLTLSNDVPTRSLHNTNSRGRLNSLTHPHPDPNSIDHIARGLDLSGLVPSVTHPDLPPLFLVNCQLPDSEPPMFGSADDGPSAFVGPGGGDSVGGWHGRPKSRAFILLYHPRHTPHAHAYAGRSAVFVFTVRPETVAALNDPDAGPGGSGRSPALQLLVEYFRCVLCFVFG